MQWLQWLSHPEWTAAWAAIRDGLGRITAEPSLLLRPDRVYLDSPDPLPAALLLCAYAAVATGLAGAVLDEYSWVDRIWSIVPWVYAWLFALHPSLALGEASPADTPFDRLAVMAALATLWGLRLTYNFWRKGGYAPGGEDYRWVRVREDMVEPWGPWAWPLFNVLFIAIFQNLLLLLIACPAYVAWVHRKDSPRMDTTGFTWDMVFVTLFALFLLVETVADEQQWRFQQAKKAAMSRRPVRAAARRASLASATGKARVAAKEGAAAPLLEGELLDGFCQSGLFRFSRHPNFFAEQCIWWVYHLLSYAPAIAAAGATKIWLPPHLNWTVVGPILLSLLFLGSTKLTEELSVEKYPKYKRYQKTTSRLLPWFPGGHTD